MALQSNSDNKNITVKVAGPSVPILGLLGVVFVTLKLLGHITWSWWWVTAPFWGPLALWLVLVTLVLIGIAGFTLLSSLGKKVS